MNTGRFKYKYRRLIEKKVVTFFDDQLYTGNVRKIIDFITDKTKTGEDKEILLTAVFMQDFIILNKAGLSKWKARCIERNLKTMGYMAHPGTMKHPGMDVYVKLPENN
jgi:hypothetical protein